MRSPLSRCMHLSFRFHFRFRFRFRFHFIRFGSYFIFSLLLSANYWTLMEIYSGLKINWLMHACAHTAQTQWEISFCEKNEEWKYATLCPIECTRFISAPILTMAMQSKNRKRNENCRFLSLLPLLLLLLLRFNVPKHSILVYRFICAVAVGFVP